MKPIFSMLVRIEGVSESSIPKEGGEPARTSAVVKEIGGGNDQEQKPKSNEPKDNVSSSSIGQENFIDDSDEEEKDEY